MKTILILDDERIVRESFSDYFEDRLWRPVQAKSGEQALELLENESPAAVVVDVRLGGMDGDAFIREARVKKPGMAFVICTGLPEYKVPHDLLELAQVSNRPFRKPVISMADLEKDVLRVIERIERKEVKDE